MLKIAIISNDAELLKSCAQMLADGVGTDWELRLCQPDECVPECDLIVWDFDPGTAAPTSGTGPYNCLFLVERHDLARFRANLAHASAGILLKPVTQAALTAFVEQRIQNGSGSVRESARIGTLRAERDEMLQSLIMTCLKLQEYDQDRTRFLTRAVHDFRAPLTALSGYCGLLLGEQLGPLTGDQHEVIQRMQQSAKRLSRLSSAMFQLGVAGRFEPNPVLCSGDLRNCIEQAVHELMQLLEEKDLAISLDVLPPPEMLLFDETQLEQLFVNLLDNAVRFTPRSGCVDIKGYPFFWERRLAQDGDFPRNREKRRTTSFAPNSYRVDVRDSGPGVLPEQLEWIFEEYTSYSGGHDRSGGGLGLAICKMIALRHHGRIWAETATSGAIFSLVLPLGAADTSETPVIRNFRQRSERGTRA